MNIESIGPYKETFFLVNDLKRLALTEKRRAETLLKRFNENGKHKVSNSFDTQSSFERLDELVKKEAKARKVKMPVRDSLTMFLREGRLYRALIDFDNQLLDYALENEIVVRQALGNVLPRKFTTYNRLVTTNSFEEFLQNITKNVEVTEESYDILSLHHDDLQREIKHVKEIQHFLDFMESFYDYREAKMQIFIKNHFEFFYDN